MSLRKQLHAPATFRQREHYLVFGPRSFTCPYTERACKLIQSKKDRCWQRKQDTTRRLYFPTSETPRVIKKGRQYETWPQIYFWNVDLKQYNYVGGYTDLAKRYGTKLPYSSHGKKQGCNSCSS